MTTQELETAIQTLISRIDAITEAVESLKAEQEELDLVLRVLLDEAGIPQP